MSINLRKTRSPAGTHRRSFSWSRPALALAAVCGLADCAAAQIPLAPPHLDNSPYSNQPYLGQVGGVPASPLIYNGGGVPVQPVQVTTDPRRPLDHRIESMPRADQKMEVIHHRSQLVVTRNRIRKIAWTDPNILDVVQFSPTEISLMGLEMGSTDLWLWFEDQAEPLMYVANVIRDPSLEERRKIDYGRIERKLALVYPNSKVYLIPMTRQVIVRGQAKDSQEAARIMQIVRMEVSYQEGNGYGNGYGYGDNYGGGAGGGADFLGNGTFNNLATNLTNTLVVDELEVPGEFQISIKVRIAEVNRSQLRRMGVDWSAIINDGAANIAQTFATGSNPILQGVFDNGTITVLIDALASNGTASILDEANLTVLSGQAAAFLSGGEFAVPTIVGIGGAQGQTTSFRGFGTSIIATPTVIDHDLIRLQIVPELSVINQGTAVGGIPGVDVRRVQTQVELREGQTIVLGGVFSRRQAAEVSRIPFLGEIPIVGHLLFNAKQSTEDETELLIVVTPEIVRPMDPDQVPPLPGFHVTHPDDIDLYKYNRIEGNADLGVYQLLPYGNGQGYGMDVGYRFSNPAPQGNGLAPVASGGAMQGGYQNVAPNGYPMQQAPYNGQPAPYNGDPNANPPAGYQPAYQQPMGAPQVPPAGNYLPINPTPVGNMPMTQFGPQRPAVQQVSGVQQPQPRKTNSYRRR